MYRLLLSFLLVLLTTTSFALPEDSKQLMHISSDSTQFDFKKGINIYEGNVVVNQGSTHLTADKVTTKNNDLHKIQEVIAFGGINPAIYTTIPNPGDELFTAKAHEIRFYPIKSLIFLEGDTSVTQGENSFQGPIMIYNTKDQIVTAPPSKNGRATMMIKPG